jgi:predicted PurR-regulated permease PerM
MPAIPPLSAWQRAYFILSTFALAILILWWAQKVFIILALATLIAFALQPVVAWLQQTGLKRLPAAILTVLLVVGILTGLGWILSWQVRALSGEWPTYQERIQEKLRALNPWEDGSLIDQIQGATESLLKGLLAGLIFPLFEILLGIVFITMLVMFILLCREDLRNRLIRLVGHPGRTVVTTRALDEAGQRISRYLLTQVLINASFGMVLMIGLYAIGLPYAPLGIPGGHHAFHPLHRHLDHSWPAVPL